MAWRAGARIVNAEYVQFHPTTLSARGAPNLLISEAVRGEGAILLTPEGKPFMEAYDPVWKDLAPRDVVARAIHMEMLEHGYEHVYLDIASKRDASYIRERFPQLTEDAMLKPSAIAETYWFLAHQDRSAWSHDVDVRPFKEKW